MGNSMNVYYNSSFEGYYPVGSAAVVVAESPEQAAHFLEGELRQHGLSQKVNADDMKLVPMKIGFVDIICDGDY